MGILGAGDFAAYFIFVWVATSPSASATKPAPSTSVSSPRCASRNPSLLSTARTATASSGSSPVYICYRACSINIALVAVMCSLLSLWLCLVAARPGVTTSYCLNAMRTSVQRRAGWSASLRALVRWSVSFRGAAWPSLATRKSMSSSSSNSRLCLGICRQDVLPIVLRRSSVIGLSGLA